MQVQTLTISPSYISASIGNSRLELTPAFNHSSLLYVNNTLSISGSEIGLEWQNLILKLASPILLTAVIALTLLYFFSIVPLILAYFKGVIDASKFNSYILPGIIISISFLFVVYTAVVTLKGIPHSQDEIAYLFQSKIFAAGRIYAESPPLEIRRFFDQEFIVNNGKWFSAFPVGFPLFLSIGTLLNVPFLVNPLFFAGSSILLYMITKKMYGKTIALFSLIFFSMSPTVVLLSASYFSHASSLFFSLLLFYALQTRRYVLGGGALGILLLIRPYTALLFAAIIIVFIIYKLLKERMTILKGFINFALTSAIFIALLFLFNRILTGSFLKLPYNVYSEFNKIGFGLRGNEWGTEFTPYHALENTLVNLYSLQDTLLPFPYYFNFLLIFIALITSRSKRMYILIGIFSTVVAGYFFYFYHGAFYGPRLWYETIPLLFIISGLGFYNIVQFLRKKLTNHLSTHQFVLPIVFSIFIFYGWIRMLEVIASQTDYAGIVPPQKAITKEPLVIIVDGSSSWQAYGMYLNVMSPFLGKNKNIYVRDQAVHNVPKNMEPLPNEILYDYFPERNFYYFSQGQLYQIPK